jgi:putative sterol carrier protein
VDPDLLYRSLAYAIDPEWTRGHRFRVAYELVGDGGGSWHVDVDDGKVTVTENGGEADATISASAETFMKIANGEQNPTAAYMSGKLKVKGDMGQAMKLQKLF